MDATQILGAFRELGEVKELSKQDLHELLKDGIMAALARRYGMNVEAEITINEDKGSIDITVLKEVVQTVEDPSREISLEEARWDDPDFQVGDVLEIPVEFSQFGRNAVMAAKQRIIQRVREGERDKIRAEYEHRVGELLSAEIQQVERGKLVIMVNRSRDADAIIPWKEQNPRERFRQGEPIRAVLKKVEETSKGPRLIFSRADPLFVAALFKLEVPEIAQNLVEIKGIAREVGGRTKVAVASRDDSIDPVGACVGLKGSRVQAVVGELGGERIDIVPWHPDPEVYARRALAPAQVAKVLSDPERGVITAIVDEDQLSLAIGRNGQNVRLASQLIGWQIDLYGSREWLEKGADDALFGGGGTEYEIADFPLNELALPAETLAALEGAGYTTFLDIIDLDRRDLLAIEGIDEGAADAVLALIDELTVEEGAAAAPAESTPSDDELEEVAELLGLEGPKAQTPSDEAEPAEPAEGPVAEDSAPVAESAAEDEETGEDRDSGADAESVEDAGAEVVASGAGDDEERADGEEA